MMLTGNENFADIDITFIPSSWENQETDSFIQKQNYLDT